MFWGILGLVLWPAAGAPSEACPGLEQGTLQVCERCVHNDLCATGLTCDTFMQKCVETAWNHSEAIAACPEELDLPATWGAHCKLECSEQKAPWGCAVNYCLNEDFPCNWVAGCIPAGLTRTSLACLRPCVDHDSMLRTAGYGDTTCPAVVGKFGCEGTWQPISEFCPVSCSTPECSYRCGRDEVVNVAQRRCWQRVELDGDSCLDAIREGQDCHCKCANIYFTLAGTQGRARGGAFQISDKFDGVALALDLKAQAGRMFTIDFTGERMRTEDPGNAEGPRMKIVSEGEVCGRDGLPTNLTGLECQPDNSGGTGWICTTPPSSAYDFLHRWGGITINACGRFLLCHCNQNCATQANWVRAGNLEVEPAVTFGRMERPLPGCDVYIPTVPPPPEPAEPLEVMQKSIITTYISLEGGLESRGFVLSALAAGFASYTSIRSDLLGKTVPEASDVEVDYFDSVVRRLEIERRAAECIDDDAVFAEEGQKVGLLPGTTTCAQAVELLLCDDALSQPAVTCCCKRACGFCQPAEQSSTTTEAIQASGTTSEPEVQIDWPGSTFALHLIVRITTRTNQVREAVIHNLQQIEMDQSQFLLVMYEELEAVGISGAAIPGQLWAYIALGPTIEEAPPDTTTTEPPPTWTASTTIAVIMGAALGASGVLSCCAVAIYMYYQRKKYAVDVGTEDQEIVQRSEGGYRMKKKIIPGQAAESEPAKPSCMSKCCEKICPKREIRRIAPVSQAGYGELKVGARVRLIGLSQAHFNGLEGFITGGPNEKGRYSVDVIVDDNEMAREMQTLSFKPDNLRVLPPENATSMAPGPGRGPNTYRARP
mmetsp:Transcript_16392/g.38835  ORF Transcript_16392/g.38835 Transcript_16392/m.38835 type:complete len:826 (-) Transcript_16392:301-2778(-)